MATSKGFISVFLKYPFRRINFHYLGRKKIKSVPTERLVKISFMFSTPYLQVPRERLHLKVVLVTHIRISCLSMLLTRYFSNRICDQRTSNQDKSISTTDKYESRMNSRDEGTCDIACCLSETFTMMCRIYYRNRIIYMILSC